MFRQLFWSLSSLLSNIVFPPLCIFCEIPLTEAEQRQNTCMRCMNKIPINSALYCADCGVRMSNNKKICHFNTPYMLAAATQYNNELVKQLIKKLKYGNVRATIQPIRALLIPYLRTIQPSLTSTVIIPIPLHPARLSTRGFNQAKLIADIASETLKLPSVDGLIRLRNTPPQTTTPDFQHRAINMHQCFATKNPELLRGRDVLLVDDVHTSGATMTAAATALREHGVRHITALTIART